MSVSPPLVTCERVVKLYRMGAHEVAAVRDVTLAIGEGEYVAVMGPSGSGKSTFMNLVGALDVPTQGSIKIAGKALNELDGDALAALRNKTVGFVFQQFNLLARTTALANVMLPLDYSGMTREAAEAKARATLARVGLADRMDHAPSELSGGQQQRVAIARALVNDPKILLADEPTGALDSVTAEEIMTLFGELNRAGITVILITHDADVAAHARRQIRFKDGRVVADVLAEAA